MKFHLKFQIKKIDDFILKLYQYNSHYKLLITKNRVAILKAKIVYSPTEINLKIIWQFYQKLENVQCS